MVVRKEIQLTDKEIYALDHRIVACTVEDPNDHQDEYYCKIYYHYEHNGKKSTDYGNKEFSDYNKDALLRKIKDFVNREHGGWKII